MGITDVANWHRKQEAACERAEAVARAAARRGCEDAEFVADGWRKRGKEHAAMAALIEAFCLERS